MQQLLLLIVYAQLIILDYATMYHFLLLQSYQDFYYVLVIE